MTRGPDLPERGPRQLYRLRWAVRGTLLLGVTASIAANILHAQNDPIAQTIAAWPPLALLVTIEVVARVPVHRRGLSAIRLLAAALIGLIAAWISYWHMVAVAARYGEAGTTSYLLPLSVDGMVVVTSVSLVELAGRIRTIEAILLATPPPTSNIPVPGSKPHEQPSAAEPSDLPDSVVSHNNERQPPSPGATPPATQNGHVSGHNEKSTPALSRSSPAQLSGPDEELPDGAPTRDERPAGDPPTPTKNGHNQKKGPAITDVPQKPNPKLHNGDGRHSDRPASEPDRASTETNDVPSNIADAVAYWQSKDSRMSAEDIAEKVGRAPRTIRRYMEQSRRTGRNLTEKVASRET